MSLAAELHNAWNIGLQEYALGKQESLSLSEQYYRDSLEIAEHPDTRYNLGIVEKLLEDNENEPKAQNQDDTAENDTGETENSDSSSGSTQESNQSQEKWRNKQNNELTQDELQQLEEITEQIKSEQNYNQQFYNKSEKPSWFQSAFDSFFWELDRGGEKDW